MRRPEVLRRSLLRSSLFTEYGQRTAPGRQGWSPRKAHMSFYETVGRLDLWDVLRAGRWLRSSVSADPA